MLCRKCQSLASLLPILPSSEAKHHSTFAELQLAVQKGCRICALFRTALLQEYANKLACSLLEADVYHRHLDKSYAGETGNNHRLCSKSRRPFRRQKSKLTKRVLNHAAFYVCPQTNETDTRFASVKRGLIGILYIRKAPDDIFSILECYPYIGLSSVPGYETVTQWPIISRQLPVTAEIALAKSWINSCITDHPLCLAPSLTLLPTRVLDLESPTSPSQICLVLGQGSTASYVALSHCWGGSQPLKLTLSTLEEFQKNISLSTLPKPFLDAVSVTRSLGFRYLWIDSLCIIQDSKADWESECSKMIDVYKNAAVTLAGPAATDCNSGFLHKRKKQIRETVYISRNGAYTKVVLSFQGANKYREHFEPERSSPWATRAWILQEKLLSRRILSLGSTKMYFECSTNVRLESCHYPITWKSEEIDGVAKQSTAQLQNNSERFGYWASIVRCYSSLQLSMKRDKLPALSGIASDIQKITGSEYLAGLWKDDLPRALTWYIAFFDSQPPYSDYIAPSWSWASNSSPASLLTYNYYLHDFRADLEICHSKIILTGANPYGEVKYGYLETRGRIQHFRVKSGTVSAKPREKDFQILGYGSNSIATYAPDNRSGMTKKESRITLLYIGDYPSLYTVAMAIEAEGASHNIYKRVGLAYAEGSSERYRLAERFNTVERTIVRIV